MPVIYFRPFENYGFAPEPNSKFVYNKENKASEYNHANSDEDYNNNSQPISGFSQLAIESANTKNDDFEVFLFFCPFT